MAVSFKILAGISSGPVALFGSSDFRTAFADVQHNIAKGGFCGGEFPCAVIYLVLLRKREY